MSENCFFMVFSVYLWPFRPSKKTTLRDSGRSLFLAPSRAAWRRSASECAGCSRVWSFGPAGQSTHPSPNDTRHTDASLGPKNQWGLSWWPSINCHVPRENMIMKGSRGTIFSDKPNWVYNLELTCPMNSDYMVMVLSQGLTLNQHKAGKWCPLQPPNSNLLILWKRLWQSIGTSGIGDKPQTKPIDCQFQNFEGEKSTGKQDMFTNTIIFSHLQAANMAFTTNHAWVLPL